MILLWSLCAVFAIHNNLEEGVSAIDLEICRLTGESSAPEIFLNATSAQVGDLVALRCLLPHVFVTKYVFCQNGRSLSVHKAMPKEVAYTQLLRISEQSAGQYSCAYQIKDERNQEKNSALSAAWNLTVLSGNNEPLNSTDITPVFYPGNSDQFNNNSSIIGAISHVAGIAGISILVLTPLMYLLIKKVVSHQRTSREETPDQNRNDIDSENQVQYADIVRDHRSVPSPTPNAEKTEYAAINPLNRKHSFNFGAASLYPKTLNEVSE